MLNATVQLGSHPGIYFMVDILPILGGMKSTKRKSMLKMRQQEGAADIPVGHFTLQFVAGLKLPDAVSWAKKLHPRARRHVAQVPARLAVCKSAPIIAMMLQISVCSVHGSAG